MIKRTNGLVSPAQTDANGHSDIRASATSDVLPKYECDHLWLTKAGAGYRFKFVEVCAKCGGEQ